ncbi:hypothetical protein [Aquirufa antheringensis]
MKINKRAFIAKELLNIPDCVSLILKEIEMDFINFQSLCRKCGVNIQSERDRLSRHDFIKIKTPLIERVKEISLKSQKSNFNYNSDDIELKKKRNKMSRSPIFDKMANQKEKIKFVITPMRD